MEWAWTVCVSRDRVHQSVSTITKMRSLSLLVAGVLLAGHAAAAPQIPNFTQQEIDSGYALRELSRIAYENAMARVEKSTSGCTKENVQIRREW